MILLLQSFGDALWTLTKATFEMIFSGNIFAIIFKCVVFLALLLSFGNLLYHYFMIAIGKEDCSF